MMEIPDNHKDRSELGKVIAWRFLFSVLIALAAWFLLPLDERVREIVVLAAFAPVTISLRIHRLADGQCQACRLLIDRYRGHRIDDHDDSARRSAGRLT